MFILVNWHVMKSLNFFLLVFYFTKFQLHLMEKIKNNGGATCNIGWPSHYYVKHWSFIQHLSNDSWTWYFWTYYFRIGTWINFQSIIVVPPCCAYPKIFTRINVETPMMDLAIPCGYCVFCCKFVDGGVSMNATFKLKHTHINWVLPWGIELLVFFGNKRVSRSADWLVNVEIQNNSWKTLYAHG